MIFGRNNFIKNIIWKLMSLVSEFSQNYVAFHPELKFQGFVENNLHFIVSILYRHSLHNAAHWCSILYCNLIHEVQYCIDIHFMKSTTFLSFTSWSNVLYYNLNHEEHCCVLIYFMMYTSVLTFTSWKYYCSVFNFMK